MTNAALLQRNTLAAVAACLAAALAPSIHAKTLFCENFMQYDTYAPRMSPDKGIRCGTDPIWSGRGEAYVDAEKPSDLFRDAITVPEGSFNATFRFKLTGKESFFDLVFADNGGKRETVRIAPDSVAGEKIDLLDNSWKYFGLKVRGRDAEFWMATDRGHEFKRIAGAVLSLKPSAFNFACTPGKKFSLTDLVVKTADEPLVSFPVEKHFAAFESLLQPLANAAVAAGTENIVLEGAGRRGVAFNFGGDASRSAKLGFKRDGGEETVWDCSIGDFTAERKDAYLSFSKNGRGRDTPAAQWVRPNMRPFCENSETGQRGMVDSGHDILREWNRLPPASRHTFHIDFTREDDGSWTLWVDGSRRQSLGSGIKEFFFRPSAGVAYAVKNDAAFAKIDRSRFEPLDFSENPRAKAMAGGVLKGIAPGVHDFGGVPVKAVAPIDSADISICRQGKGNWALEVEEYHGRHPYQGFPMAVHYRVPAATYVKAHILFALDPSPGKDPILTLRLGRYETNGVGGNTLGDTVLDFSGGVPEYCRKAGEVEFCGKTVPLYYAEVPLNPGPVVDLAAQRGSYMEFDLTGKGWENFQQLDNRMKPDPNSDSAFNIFGATLEKAPFDIVIQEAQPGNIFTADEQGKKTSFAIAARGNASGSVSWSAKDLDGAEVFKGGGRFNVAAGSTNVVDIPFGDIGPGWYSLDIAFSGRDGRKLFSHEAAIGIMPEAGRKVSRRDSPYAVWWFNCHGSTGKPEIGGPIMKKTGIRKFSWNSFDKTVKDDKGRNTKTIDQELYDKYDVAGCGNFMMPRRHDNFDNEKGVFKDKTLRSGETVSGEDWFVQEVRKALDKMPKDTVATPMIWHESAPSAFLAEEILGLPVPKEPAYKMAWADAKYINECARLLRKHFPDLAPRLQIGNSTWSAGAVIGPLRAGANRLQHPGTARDDGYVRGDLRQEDHVQRNVGIRIPHRTRPRHKGAGRILYAGRHNLARPRLLPHQPGRILRLLFRILQRTLGRLRSHVPFAMGVSQARACRIRRPYESPRRREILARTRYRIYDRLRRGVQALGRELRHRPLGGAGRRGIRNRIAFRRDRDQDARSGIETREREIHRQGRFLARISDNPQARFVCPRRETYLPQICRNRKTRRDRRTDGLGRRHRPRSRSLARIPKPRIPSLPQESGRRRIYGQNGRRCRKRPLH